MPTTDLEYDYFYTDGTITYSIYDLIHLLNYQGDPIEGIALWFARNYESDYEPIIRLDGDILPLASPDDFYIFKDDTNWNFNSTIEISASEEFSIIDGYVSAYDGTNWTEYWEKFQLVSVGKIVHGSDYLDDTFDYVVNEHGSYIFDGFTGFDTLNLTIADLDWSILNSIDADDDNLDDAEAFIILDHIDQLNLTLPGGANWSSINDRVENISFGDGNTTLRLNFGPTNSFAAGEGNSDFIDANVANITEGVVYDLIAGTVTRTGGYDNISGFEFFNGTAYNDFFYGADEGRSALPNLKAIFSSDDYIDLTIAFENIELFRNYFSAEIFYPGSGADLIDGGSDGATVHYNYGSEFPDNGITANLADGIVVDPWGYTDQLVDINSIVGTNADDTLMGSTGDDYFSPRNGNDTINGFDGIDTISYSSHDMIAVNLSSSDEVFENYSEFSAASNLQTDIFNEVYFASGDAKYTDSILNVENILATEGDDFIYGNSSPNALVGLSGNDWIFGGNGDDVILGGAGNDQLFGGTGDDIILGQSGSDLIKGGDGYDTVYLAEVESNFTLTEATDHLILKDNSTGDQDTLWGIERIVYSDAEYVLPHDNGNSTDPSQTPTCYFICFDDFGVSSLLYDNVVLYDYDAEWKAGWNWYNLDSLAPDELKQLPYFDGFGLDIVSDDISGIYGTFDDENDLEKSTSDYIVSDFDDNDEYNDYYAWYFDDVNGRWVLDYLNDLDGEDAHPWLQEGLELGWYLTNYEVYPDLDGEVDFYDIDDTDAWDKIDLDPVNDYVFYNWEDNRSPVEGTEAYSLLSESDIQSLSNTEYLPDYPTHGDIVLNNFFDQLDEQYLSNVKIIAIDISDEIDGDDIWTDDYFMENFDTQMSQILSEQGVSADDLVIANFSNTIPGAYPDEINAFLTDSAFVTASLPNDGKWANRFWDAFAEDAVKALPDVIKVSGTEPGQEGYPLALDYSDVAAPTNDSRLSGDYGTSYAAPKVAAELVEFYFETINEGSSFAQLSIDDIKTKLSQSFSPNNDTTGSPIISGTAFEGETLTADTSSIDDADGLGTFSYQWRRGDDDISGATGSSYVLTADDVGYGISVRVSYTDGRGTTETLLSKESETVISSDVHLLTINGQIYQIGPGVDLSSTDLSGAAFEGVNLENANFTGSNLTNAYIDYPISLRGANFSSAVLDNMYFGDADLTNALFNGATSSTRIWFYDVDLTNVDLSTASFQEIVNGGGVTGNPILPDGYHIMNGFIIGPNVTVYNSSNFDSNYLDGENFSGLNLTGFQLITDWRSDQSLASANLAGSNLSNANFEGTSLIDSDFSNTNLTAAVLRNTDLAGAKLFGADLTSADLTGADLTGAFVDSNTILPSNISSEQLSDLVIPDHTSWVGNSLVPATGYYFDGSGNAVSDSNNSPVILTVHDRDGEALRGFELLSIEQRHDYSKFTDVTNVGDALSLEIGRAPDSSFDISVVANPDVDVAAVNFSIVDENGINGFELGSALSGWSVTTNPASATVDKSIAVGAIGATNASDALQAGSETVLASYSSSAQSDILLTGGILGSQFQSEVHASASITTTDATGQASFDFSSEKSVFVDTVHSYSNAFPNTHVNAQDAFSLMQMLLDEENSPEQLIAADFNRDGVVDIWDVKGILEYSVALPGSDEAEWVLVDSGGDYSGITENNVNYDSGIDLHGITTDTSVSATAILIGDVNNSFV